MRALGATQALLKKRCGALVDFEQRASQFRFMRPSRSTKRGLRQRDIEFLRDRPHSLRESDVLNLLNEAEDVSLGAASEAIEELARLVDVERWRFFVMKRALAGKILRSRLLELHIVAHDADNVGLLFEGVGEVSGVSHRVERVPQELWARGGLKER